MIYLPEVLFIKAQLLYLNFSVCHVVLRLVAPSFSLANSLISTDVLCCSARRLQKTLLVKLILMQVATKIDLKLKTFFLREELIVKKQKRQ